LFRRTPGTARTSCIFSNISPQLPGFNRGIWKKLENKVRTWAKTYDCLYIATGAVCQHPAKSIGKNSITIPTHFYKTVLTQIERLSLTTKKL